jgi:uncharacterized protein (DUF433 family)
MSREQLLTRILVDPSVCGGKPVIRGTRVMVAIVLDSLAEGMTTAEFLDHYPHLTTDDVRAAMAYGAVLAQENTWKIAV